ncbi:MAG: hypothetical protein ACOYMS_05950 [Terrimicrobiaceae bacterium]
MKLIRVLLNWLWIVPPAIVVIIAVTYLADRFTHSEDKNQLPFDQTVWKANPGSTERNPIRLRMVDDLLSKYKFKGMSRKQIDDLLGPSAPTDKYSDWDLVYWLGPERGRIRIDSEWLVFRFDDDGKVTKFEHLRD